MFGDICTSHSHVLARGEDETWYAEVRMLFSFTHPAHQQPVDAAYVRWFKIVDQRADGGVLLKWEKEQRRDGSLVSCPIS